MKLSNDNSGVRSRRPSADRKLIVVVKMAAVFGATVLFAFALSGFFSPDGLAPHEYWWLLIVAVAVAVIGLSVRTSWQMAGLVAATFLAGFGVQLALKDPFWFQHIRIRPTSGFSYLMLAVLGLQGMTAALVLLRSEPVKHAIRILSEFGWWRVFLVCLLLVAASKGAMGYIAEQNYPRFFKQLSVAVVFLAFNMSSLAALVVTLPKEALVKLGSWATQAISLPGGSDQIRRFDKAFPVCAAGAVFGVCVFISLTAFEAVPHLDDIIYLFQARYFSSGQLSLPIPASTEAFGHYLMDINGDKWFAVTSPGWPLALAAGSLVNMPWIINPLLAAVSILLAHSLVKSLADRGTANLVLLLMAISPWYLFASSTLLLHTFTYALLLGAWVLLISARERPSLAMPFAAGALMGWLFLARPLEGLYMGVLTGLWTLTFLGDRRQWKTIALYGAGCLAIGALIFPYHAYLTGDPLATPMNAYLDKIWGTGANAIGFGPDIGPPNWGNVDVYEGHSPIEALINFQQNLYVLNSELFGWGGASLFFALCFMFWGRWSRLTAAMAIICVVTVILYSMYWFAAAFYIGPRYWFLTLFPLLIFTALGITTFIRKLETLYPTGLVPHRIGATVVFLFFCSILIFGSWLGFNKYPEIRGYHDDYHALMKQQRFRNALVFISTDTEAEYGSAFWLNDFSASADSPIFARDLGAETNRRVAEAYPSRTIFFVEGRSKSQSHVAVSRGPLSTDEIE